MKMECLYCKGKMASSSAPLDVDRNGFHIHWDSLPAWVCTQCGEPYFEEAEVQAVERAVSAVDQEFNNVKKRVA
jgi:YgiT-type zinc finger domain-containing protein